MTLEPGQTILVKRGWILEDVFVFSNPQQSEILIKILVEKEDGQIHWVADAKGEFRDSFVVTPREIYSVTNAGSESVTFTNFEFQNTVFYYKDGNFKPSQDGMMILSLYILISGIVIMIVGYIIARRAGESWIKK